MATMVAVLVSCSIDADQNRSTDSFGIGDGIETDAACVGEPVVHFVYFVESDEIYSELERSNIEDMAFAFQQYWYEQLGVTFYLNDPVVDVIDAEHDALWYVDTPDGIHDDSRWYRLGNISTEVFDKLGSSHFDSHHRIVNYPIARYDGRVGVNFGGAWMDGDDMTCMATPGGNTYPYDEDGPAHCMGHVAHEFGHVLGLGHTGPDDDCMQFGFYNSAGGDGICSFSEENVSQILADPGNTGWLKAVPGDICIGAE